MVALHRLNGAQITVNAELIEYLEGGPQTCVVLATGNKITVKESVDEIVEKVIAYRKKVNVDAKVINPISGYKRENP